MTNLKPIIKERETLNQLMNGASIARFGDGELRLALGVSVGHQQAHPKLVEELNHILKNPTKCLVGIPYIENRSPRAATWRHYGADKYTKLYNLEKQYYSAFITRPDSAPWIANQQYWEDTKSLYKGKDVIIVSGSRKGFRAEEIENDVNSLKFIEALPQEAYAEIDRIEAEIGDDTNKIVLLAVGATATILAYRLAERGFQALDLGHLPMFIRRDGGYAEIRAIS